MSGWPLVPVREFCDVVSGATPKTGVGAYWDGDIPWATPKDLSDLAGSVIADTPRKLTAAGLKSCPAVVLPPHSVLFSSRAPIGHVAVNAVPMATNQGFKSLVPKAGRADARYLYHWLRAHRGYLESLGTGATFKEVSKRVVEAIEIPLPPLAEQQRIAAVLDQVDALRDKRSQALTLLGDLDRSLFREMFGDPTPRKQTAGSRLRDIAQIQTGPFGSLLHREDYVVGAVPLVNPMHIVDGEIKPDREQTVSPEKAAELSAFRLRPGDLVMGRRGEMGRCAVVTPEHGPLLCGTGSLIIRPRPEAATAEYLRCVISHAGVKRYLQDASLGATLPNLNQKIVGGVPVQVPPMDRQLEFGRRLRALRAVREQHHRHLAALDELFSSLHTRAFAGRLWDH